MYWISVIGVVAILALAYALSTARRAIQPRVILWGLYLQFIFALMMLRHDVWSMIGMGLVLGQIVYFLVLRAARGTGLIRIRCSIGALVVSGGCLWMFNRQLYGQDLLATVANGVAARLTR